MVDNPRGTGPRASPMPSRRMKMERMPNRPSMVDTGSQRLGMQRQSPMVYRISFSKEGVSVQDPNGEVLNDKEAFTVADVASKQLNNSAQENRQGMRQDGMQGNPVPPPGKVDVTMMQGPRRPEINYTEGRGIPSTRDAVMKTSPLQASPQFREGPEMRLAPKVEDVELPKLRRKKGGKAKRMMYGGKMKKYAKGGGIRKAKYS
jgi:hypothetical protein|tara:strand:+ start:10407 stop:11018 length:612 start_codon:yes stop_codon:yes gene_type:complete